MIITEETPDEEVLRYLEGMRDALSLVLCHEVDAGRLFEEITKTKLLFERMNVRENIENMGIRLE